MDIGKKLLELRKEKGYSQEEVAEKLGVTRQTISKWETEQSTPDFDKIVPLCELYEITTDELFTGTKKEVQEKNEINIDNRSNERRKSTAAVLSVSIFLYFISIIAIILGEEVFNLNDALSVSIFLLIAGFATVLLVYHFVSLPKNRLDANEPKKKTLENDKRYKYIISIVSTIFTVIYLLISFLTMAWHITWIIWLVYVIVDQIIKLVFYYKDGGNYEE